MTAHTIPALVAMVAQPAQQQQACAVKFTARNDNPNTIWNRLAARLGREPTSAEASEECQRIMRGEPAPAMVSQPCQQQQAQHTPGPWFANITSTETVAMVWAEQDEAQINAAPIADCADFEERRPVAEARSNAVLIAAAPDMLEALRKLYDLCVLGASADAFRNGVTDSTGTIDEGDVRASECIDRARLAITKAEGRV